jgi:hypothetical protein
MIRILALASIAVIALVEGAGVPQEHQIPDQIPPTTVYRPATTSTSSSTTTVPVAATTPATTAPATTTATPSASSEGSGRCGEWWPTALSAGWPEHRLDVLDDILWDESRCQADVTSSTGDWGLLQINWATWGDYVESFGLTREDLLVPTVNLWLGLQIADLAGEAGWGWCQPWHMSGERTCGQ